MLNRNDKVEWIAEPLRCPGVNVQTGDILTVINEVPGKKTGYIMLTQIDGPYKGISFFASPDEFIPTKDELMEVDFL